MSTKSQAIVWRFATAFRRHTQQEVTYLRFQRDSVYKMRIIREALQSGNSELISLANMIVDRLDDDSVRDNQAQDACGLVQPSIDENETSERAGTPSSAYRIALRTQLRDGVVGLENRCHLDAYVHELGIAAKRAVSLERSLRREKNLSVLDWYEELAAIVQSQLEQGALSETTRQRLQATYVRPGRLSITDFNDYLSGFLKAGRRSKRMVGSVSLLASALAGVVTLGFVVGNQLPERQLRGNEISETVETAPGAADSPVQRREVRVLAPIHTSTVWHASNTYVLEDVIFVESGVSLTIEAGTQVLGKQGSALVVSKDARLYARGRKDAPIIFSSARPAGQRERGDWGGLVMLGNAPINRGTARIEGIDETDPRGQFGGRITGDNCGLLEYVRIEFAGYEAFANNELNGLTLGGCGNKTIVRHVQVHKSLDDGIEVFGGDVDMSHIVVTGARDDSFDWDMGWQGRVQFLVVQQHPDAGDNGFEADNSKKDHQAVPRSAPTFYNVTLVGALNPERARRAMTLRRGTGGIFRNFIITGFDKEAIDVRDGSTAALTKAGDLSLDHSLFYEIGVDGRTYFSSEGGKEDDDAGFPEEQYFRQPALANRFDLSPQLSRGIFDTLSPNFSPLPLSPAAQGAATVPEDEFWDQGANYLGAIRPGSGRTWLSGWTAFPKG